MEGIMDRACGDIFHQVDAGALRQLKRISEPSRIVIKRYRNGDTLTLDHIYEAIDPKGDYKIRDLKHLCEELDADIRSGDDKRKPSTWRNALQKWCQINGFWVPHKQKKKIKGTKRTRGEDDHLVSGQPNYDTDDEVPEGTPLRLANKLNRVKREKQDYVPRHRRDERQGIERQVSQKPTRNKTEKEKIEDKKREQEEKFKAEEKRLSSKEGGLKSVLSRKKNEIQDALKKTEDMTYQFQQSIKAMMSDDLQGTPVFNIAKAIYDSRPSIDEAQSIINLLQQSIAILENQEQLRQLDAMIKLQDVAIEKVKNNRARSREEHEKTLQRFEEDIEKIQQDAIRRRQQREYEHRQVSVSRCLSCSLCRSGSFS